jgi:acyl-coenzyme A synthetase/AMP-(fatty) acid ligase
MSLTYQYFGPFTRDISGTTAYLWHIYKNGVLLDEKRIVPVPGISPDVWDNQQEAIKTSAEKKLVSLGFTLEEANFICLLQG